jgi:hypothetical protein
VSRPRVAKVPAIVTDDPDLAAVLAAAEDVELRPEDARALRAVAKMETPREFSLRMLRGALNVPAARVWAHRLNRAREAGRILPMGSTRAGQAAAILQRGRRRR